MRIYKSEKDAGINFDTNSDGDSTSFVTSTVRVGDIGKYFDGMSIADLIQSTNTVQTIEELLGEKQPDLALVVSILVSTGLNKNDEIFTPEEVWKARSSPLHKPMNDNHDAKKILGHIVESRVLDKSGNVVDASEDGSPPKDFDIEVAGVLYRGFPELSERIDEIIEKSKAGEMFVSMEAWFSDFGYGIIDSATGDIKLIERTESTAFLTKHLRIYGGSGNYQGFQIGRVLKNIVFGAQGFTEEPANPDSIIKVAASRIAANGLNELSEGRIKDMDEKQLKELQAKLEEAEASLTTKTEEITKLQTGLKEFKSKNYEDQVATLETKVDDLTVGLKEKTDEAEKITIDKDEIKKQSDELQERVNKSEAELEKIRKNAVATDRLSKLSEIKTIKDEKATLAELREMTDETFAVVIKYAGEINSKDNDEDNNNDDSEEKAAELAEAALNSVKEDDTADFNATDDTSETEANRWLSTANRLCGREEKEEGGE